MPEQFQQARFPFSAPDVRDFVWKDRENNTGKGEPKTSYVTQGVIELRL